MGYNVYFLLNEHLYNCTITCRHGYIREGKKLLVHRVAGGGDKQGKMRHLPSGYYRVMRRKGHGSLRPQRPRVLCTAACAKGRAVVSERGKETLAPRWRASLLAKLAVRIIQDSEPGNLATIGWRACWKAFFQENS